MKSQLKAPSLEFSSEIVLMRLRICDSYVS